MKTLRVQLSELRRELSLKVDSQNNRQIIEAQNNIFNRVKSPSGEFSQLATYAKAINQLLITSLESEARTNINERLAILDHCLNAFIKRWASEGHSAREGEELAKLNTTLNVLNGQLKETLENVWENWAGEIEASTKVEQVLLKKLELNPRMTAVCQSFKEISKRLSDLLENLPQSEESITEIQSIQYQLIGLRGKMDFDVPDDVNEFLRHINGFKKTAPLAMLTPEVFNWLYQHDLLNEYEVSRSRR